MIKRHVQSLSHEEAAEVVAAIAGMAVEFIKGESDLGRPRSRGQGWNRERNVAQQPDAH